MLKVLLLKLASDWVLVTEDEVNLEITLCQNDHMNIARTSETHLCSGASQVGTKHDGPRSLVRKLLTCGLETIFKQLKVATTAVAALLVLDLILDN